MKYEGKSLPNRGTDGDQVLRLMREAAAEDVRWREGRVFGLVFHPGDELGEFLMKAHNAFFSENGLNPTAFPSLRKFEIEVVSMVASLLHGDAEVVGNMTSGGTESILMAVKAARDRAMARTPKLARPEIVLPSTAHPAFDKAAHYFNLEAVHVPVGKDFRADVKATRKALSKNTALVVGSAPSYPHGVVDPISELAQLARKRDIPFHVDACIGGMMLPFVQRLGYPIPPFDFIVPGVTSISADLHKYGYAANGASVILYRNAELRRHQYFAYTDWPGGIYASPTMTGTRPGGAIASAWAMLHRLGYEGYQDIARDVMGATRRIRAGIDRIDGIYVLGDPQASLLAIASDRIDIYEVGDRMSDRGWHLERQQFPPSLHLTISRSHVRSAGSFLEDLRDAVRLSRKEPIERLIDRSKLLVVSTMARVLPSKVVSKVTAVASAKLGIEGGNLPNRTAAMYGMLATLPNRGDLRTLVLDILDKMTKPADQ
ncbi:MAG: aspartate aminotransferase family protein [Polyangiaceae bacterium]|jgi:glutamate/tyrosine decarboxylase-like PLP-dependent enzyme|nr:aspartate aminotransferase family protein [Polyangiaceae bacterium]